MDINKVTFEARMTIDGVPFKNWGFFAMDDLVIAQEPAVLA